MPNPIYYVIAITATTTLHMLLHLLAGEEVEEAYEPDEKGEIVLEYEI